MATKGPPDARECDPSLHFDVDCLILEYLIYNATRSVLEHAHSRPADRLRETRKAKEEHLPSEVDNVLHMVDAFLRIFTSSHSMVDAPSSLRFRLRLLQFATLFVFRELQTVLSPAKSALLALRRENASRAGAWLARWLERASDDISPRGRQNCFHAQEAVAKPDEVDDQTSSLPTLLDILPLFVELTAARSNDGEWPISDAWLELAGEMMLQGLLEQYLILGCVCFEPVYQAFAWGFEGMEGLQSKPAPERQGDTEAFETIELASASLQSYSAELGDRANIVFCHVEQPNEATDLPSDTVLQLRSNPAWSRIRHEYVRLVLEASEATDTLQALKGAGESSSATKIQDEVEALTRHCRTIAAAHPTAPFNAQVLSFLQALSESIAQPILTQLEQASDDDDAVLELDIDFERVRITGDEAAELKRLASELQGVK